MSVQARDEVVSSQAARRTGKAPAVRNRSLRMLLARADRFAIVGVLVVLIIASQIAYGNFLSTSNIMNLLSENAPAGIMAIGMTFVILTGGFDLSVGGIYAGAATVAASFGRGHNVAFAFGMTLLLAAVAGLVNAFIVTVLRVNTFVATLGTGLGFTGVALIYSNSAPFIVSNSSFTTLGGSGVGVVPYSVILMAVLFVLGQLVLSFTIYGRQVYAIGSNNEAARLAGLRTRLVRGSTFVVSALCAGLGGILIASKLGEGQADIGSTIALTVIAMVVVGGTALSGGDGAVWRSAVGLLILAILNNVFNSISLNANWQLLIEGGLIIAAVAIEGGLQALRARR